MSVVIVVKVSEGLVLAADSAANISGQLTTPEGQVLSEGVLKSYYTARKLIQIGDLPIGVLTWGQGNLGPRTIESYIREWEFRNGWQSHDSFKERYGDVQYSVRAFADGLQSHLSEIHARLHAGPPMSERPALGVIVAGYSDGAVFPEIWRFVLPYDQQIVNQRPDKNGEPDFGASWFGLTDSIVRLHFGIDDAAVAILSEKLGTPQTELRKMVAEIQYQIPFGLMPLQDATEYASYLMNTAVGRFRFVIGPELVGGKVDIAIITQRQFKWIAQKSWQLGD